MSDAVDLLKQFGVIDTLELAGWRIDVEYPEDREEAEEWLQDD